MEPKTEKNVIRQYEDCESNLGKTKELQKLGDKLLSGDIATFDQLRLKMLKKAVRGIETCCLHICCGASAEEGDREMPRHHSSGVRQAHDSGKFCAVNRVTNIKELKDGAIASKSGVVASFADVD